MSVQIIPNEEISEIFVGVPPGHKHLRVCVRIKGDWLIFSEATTANLLRAFVTVKTHPQKTLVHLSQKVVKSRKPDFATHQLLESGETEEGIRRRFEQLWGSIENSET